MHPGKPARISDGGRFRTGGSQRHRLFCHCPRQRQGGADLADACEALAKLKDGNARYLAAPQLCEADLSKRRDEVAKGQAPWVTIFTCADSRVPRNCSSAA